MIRAYLLIVLLGAAGGALAKAGTFLGLLNLEASTTAFLVAVIGAAVQLIATYTKKLERDDFGQFMDSEGVATTLEAMRDTLRLDDGD